MLYALKVATRYLFSSKFQTMLLLGGVGVGVLVYCFMAALINGLNEYQIAQTTGNIAHITIEPAEQAPQVLPAGDGSTSLVATVLRANTQREQIRSWPEVLKYIESHPQVRIAVPVIAGNGLLTRGQAVAPVVISGVRPEQLSDIAAIAPGIVQGKPDLDADGVVIGDRLARKLSVSPGQNLVIRSDRNRGRIVRVNGIFSLGVETADEKLIYLNFNAARTLLDLDHGISRLDVKLHDLNAAPAVAAVLAASTGLKVTSWTETNLTLFRSLEGNTSTGSTVRFFSMITIVIGVASALLLASMRRRAEIGIMRSMGATRRFITAVFVIQGAMIGLLGAVVGAVSSYGFSTWLAGVARRSDGTPILPIDPDQGAYLAGIVLATVVSSIAAILPALRAASVDPVDAINQ